MGGWVSAGGGVSAGCVYRIYAKGYLKSYLKQREGVRVGKAAERHETRERGRGQGGGDHSPHIVSNKLSEFIEAYTPILIDIN